jgi:4-carboxymuconolactone decarboxylase
MTDPTQRIPRITDAERTDEVREMFAAMAGVGVANIDNNHVLTTFAQHPALTQPFLIFNRHLLTTSLVPVRLRQIAILRVAWTRRATYMWASHLRTSLRLGLSAADFAAVQQGAAVTHWSEAERSVLNAVDQLCERSDLDDEHWNALAVHLDRRQIMDFLFTVGTYVMLALAFNAMRIQREPELEALALQHGSPVEQR